MKYSNLHTHSIFSDGIETPEEIVLAAIAQGFVSVGLSDHSYTAFDTSYCMHYTAEPAYRREIRRLARKYEDQIEVYAGLELDGYSEMPDREGYDYLIGDVHYLALDGGYSAVDHDDDQEEAIRTVFGGDPLAYARCYFETYVECQRRHRPDVLGHFDLPTRFGCMPEESPVYRKIAADALLASLEITPVLELNSGAVAAGKRKVPYPASFLLREAMAHGAKFLLSSDAHRTPNLHFYHEEMAELLKRLGCRTVVQMRGRRFTEVEI